MLRLFVISGVFMMAQSGVFSVTAHAQSSTGNRLSGFIGASSGNIFRGIQRNQYEASVQAGVRYQWQDNVFFGAQLSQAQFRKGARSLSDDVAFDYFVGLSRPLGDVGAMQLRFSRFTYPGSSDQFVEYDYNEVLVGFELGDAFTLSASLSDVGTDFSNGEAYAQLTWSRAVWHQAQLSVAWGGVKELGEDDTQLAYWDVGISQPFGRVMIDFRFHDSPQQRLWYGLPTADNQWVLSATLAW